MSVLPPDHHVHTSFCGHAAGSPCDYAEAGFAQGIPSLVITDHIPAPDGYDPQTRMPPATFPQYEAAVRHAQALWPGRILFGIEADYYPGCESWLEPFLRSHPFDFVLGSIHFLGDWAFDNPTQRAGWQRRPLKTIWSEYFQLVRRMAETGWFDAAAHFDLPKKFGHRLPDSVLLELAEPALQAIRSHNMVLEINTSGLRKPIKEIYPAPALLRRACTLQIPILFGSDAHQPTEVGDQFIDAMRIARASGYERYAIFETKRRYRVHPLGGGALLPNPSEQPGSSAPGAK